MARTQPRSIFGVHSVTPYSRSTGLPYGELRVLKGSSLSLSGELIELTGGSSKYAWASEEGVITSELTISTGELPDFMFELFLGKAPTAASASATGSVSTVANKYGTSIVDASNGIDAVEVTSGDDADLKFGKYTIVATGTAAFDVYYLSSIDLARGTDGAIVNDALKITSSPLSVSAADAVIADFGLTFSKVGTPAFTTGDTATFEVLPPHDGSSSVTIGGSAYNTFPEFGAIVYAQKRGNQEMLELDLFRCKSAGMPLPFEMGQFATYEVKAKVLYDEALDGIFSMRHIKGL